MVVIEVVGVVVGIVDVVVLVQSPQMSVSDNDTELQTSPQLSWQVLCLVRMQLLQPDHSPQVDGHSYGAGEIPSSHVIIVKL